MAKIKSNKTNKKAPKKLRNGNYSDFYYASQVIKAHDREGGKERVRAHKRIVKINLKRILTFLLEFGIGYVGVKAFLKWLGDDYLVELTKTLQNVDRKINTLEKHAGLSDKSMEALTGTVGRVARISGENRMRLEQAIAHPTFQEWLKKNKNIHDLGKKPPGN